jgi:acyl-CoA thioester hydrolase
MTPSLPPSPETGRIEGGVHRLPVRVYYEDTDAGGIVYHANHLKFAERARTEMLRCLGLDHGAMRERFGLAFAVRRCRVDYLAPARLDDALLIETRLVRLGGASLDLEQRVIGAARLGEQRVTGAARLGEQRVTSAARLGEQRVTSAARLLVRLELRLVLLSTGLRVARLPAELNGALAALAKAAEP